MHNHMRGGCGEKTEKHADIFVLFSLFGALVRNEVIR